MRPNLPRSVRRLAIAGGLIAALPSASDAQARPGAPRGKTPPVPAADTTSKLSSGTLSSLRFRSIGPAVTGGRIGEIVIDPTTKTTWYVAVHSGGVWKTKLRAFAGDLRKLEDAAAAAGAPWTPGRIPSWTP